MAKTDATAAFLASLEEPKLSSLLEAGKKPPIQILPPGMSALSASITIKKKPALGPQTSQQQPGKPLAIEAPPPSGPAEASTAAVPPTASVAAPGAPIAIGTSGSDAQAATPATAIGAPSPGSPDAAALGAPPSTSEASEPASEDRDPNSSTGSKPDMVASAESNQTSSASETPAPDATLADKPVAEVPPATPDNQETIVPTTLPTSDPLV